MSDPFSQTSAPLIHLGFPKAMSSWLQKHFFRPEYGFIKAMDALGAQLTIINPPPFGFSPEPAREWCRQSLAENTPTGGMAGAAPLITAEALSGNMYSGGYNGQELADRLAQVAPGARILLMIREQRALIRSLYKSLIVWGMPHTIKRLLHPIDPQLTPQFNLDFLRFDQRVAYYQALFGPDKVLVLPMELFETQPQALLERIQGFAGIAEEQRGNLERLPVKKRVNQGQTLAYLYLERLRNRFLVSGPFNYSGLLPSTEARTLKRIKRSKQHRLPRFTDSWFEQRFRETVARETAGAFADSNQNLERLTGLSLAPYGYELPATDDASKPNPPDWETPSSPG